METGATIRSYTLEELKALAAESKTDWERVRAMTDEEVERLVAEDPEERGMVVDWGTARLVAIK